MSLIKMPVMVLLSAIVFLISFPASSDSSGVVLALSGGGLRGLAHVGVIKVLSDNDIPIVGIVGTSMGALVGGLTAIGYSTDQIIEIVTDIDITASLAEHSGRVFVPVDAHYDVNVPSGYWLRRTRTGDQLGPLGFFSAAKLYEKFTNLASKVEVVDFMNLPIPFAAIATDIETGEKVVLRAGSIASAMRASIAIPGLFEPWRIGDRLLVDGGLVSNLPVLTAKEIFSGFPIVAVDVTDKLERSNRVGSIVDVLDRSITIMTHQNVLEERKYADVIITPEVYGFGIFDESKKEAIIEEGIKAANEKLEIIKSILRFSPERKLIRVDDTNDVLVKDVVVTGLSMEASALIREKYLHWIWKPADAKAIIAASKEIADRSDILAADYHIINEDGLVVYFEVVPLPDTEWGVSGYTTNIDPYRSIYLRGTFRNLISERDSLHGLLKIGEEWGIDLNYRTDPSPMNHWEFRYSLQHLNFEPVNSANKNWRRHGFGVSHWFDFGNLDIGLGYAYEYIDGTGGSNNSSGPVFSLSLNTLDVPSDPTKGSALTLYAWWADFDQVLFRVDYFQPLKISNVWRAYLRLGFAEGNYNEIGQATYLGSAEELLSVAANPIEAERIAWANIAFRRVISRSVLGTITGEIFAGIGYAWGKNGETYMPWETGISISVPNNLINTKFAVFYTSEREWRFGFFLGNPVWNYFPIP